jgi:leucyl aminopeptidase
MPFFLDHDPHACSLHYFNHQEALNKWLWDNCDEAYAKAFEDHPALFLAHQNTALICFDEKDPWGICAPLLKLPRDYSYVFVNTPHNINDHCVAWALAFYDFHHHKTTHTEKKTPPRLVWPEAAERLYVRAMVRAISTARDLINEPANVITPFSFAKRSEELFEALNVHVDIEKDLDILKKEYPLLYTVGRASENPPCMIHIRYAPSSYVKKIALVGKGVCFDSGGLDIKPSAHMLHMKKDMGGAAHALALGYLIAELKLPIAFDMYIPCAENAVGSRSYRPRDILVSRKGLTVEVGNTDAEGRLILADALTKASEKECDLIIDFATLTGAARVAMGLDLPAFFTNQEGIRNSLQTLSSQCHDDMWALPLFEKYRKTLKSSCADLSSTGSSSYGGAITAALFLEHFIEKDNPWIHVDLMAYNITSTPGRPEGGEVMGLRAVFNYLISIS